MNNSGIELLLSSDFDYEELTVEMYYDGKFIALLNQDNGSDNLRIEFPTSTVADETLVLRKMDLAILEQALILAKKRIQG